MWPSGACQSGAWNRNRTGTPAMNEAADFKSAVSTYSTIQATLSASTTQASSEMEARAGVEPTYTDLQSGA